MVTEEERQRLIRRRDERRQAAIKLLGSKCAKCDATEGLDFDHIDPSTKLFNISSILISAYDTLLIELAKCQLLCVKCHKLKHDKLVGHGEGVAGKNKCKCHLCREKKLEYERERYWKRVNVP